LPPLWGCSGCSRSGLGKSENIRACRYLLSFNGCPRAPRRARFRRRRFACAFVAPILKCGVVVFLQAALLSRPMSLKGAL
jgi:hypothetical protein